MKNLLLVGCCWLVAGCSSLPPAIEDPPVHDVTYYQAGADPAGYQGAPVRWGGVIIDLQNEPSHSLLQVMAYPLNHYGRPLPRRTNLGRFYVKSSQFLDPAIYAQGREVTAAGNLNGNRDLKIGNTTLKLPIVEENTLYLWPDYNPPPYYWRGGFGFGSYYPYGGFYGYPYYWDGFYGTPYFPY